MPSETPVDPERLARGRDLFGLFFVMVAALLFLLLIGLIAVGTT